MLYELQNSQLFLRQCGQNDSSNLHSGKGISLSLVAPVPISGLVYSDVTIYPGGFLDQVKAPDPDIPIGIAGAKWYEIPHIWWREIEQMFWTLVAEQYSGCRFGSVQARREYLLMLWKMTG